MTTACVICTRRQPHDGWTVCDTCLGHLDDNLARIVELTRLAAGWLAPRTTAGEGQRTVPGSRPPLDVAALDAALGNDVLPLLESWERMIREDAHLSPYGAATAVENATVARSVAFLRSWLLWAAEAPAWPIEELAREIRDARTTLEHLDPDHDRPEGTRIPCTAPHPDHDGRDCGYRLTVDINHAADDITCRRCGNTTTAGRIMLAALGNPAVTVWAYPADINDALGIAEGTLRQWHNRGHITRNGNRYDVGAAWRRKMDA